MVCDHVTSAPNKDTIESGRDALTSDASTTDVNCTVLGKPRVASLVTDLVSGWLWPRTACLYLQPQAPIGYMEVLPQDECTTAHRYPRKTIFSHYEKL